MPRRKKNAAPVKERRFENRISSVSRLTLGELEARAGTGAAWLLTFFHTRITSQEAGFLQCWAISQIMQKQGAGNSVADGTSLTGNSSTAGLDFDIIGLGSARQMKGCQQGIPQHLGGEIVIYGPVINGDLAGAEAEINSCDGVLTASCGGMGDGGAHVQL